MISGNFTINNNVVNRLFNLSSLTITSRNDLYVRESGGTGLQYFTPGLYSFQTNFSITESNNKDKAFQVILFFSTKSATTPPILNTNQVYGNMTGPKYLQYNALSYNYGNDGIPGYIFYPSSDTKDTGTNDCPLIEIFYPCKTNSGSTVYSNYYTFSYIFTITETDLGINFFQQFAYDGTGSVLQGYGNFYINFLGS